MKKSLLFFIFSIFSFFLFCFENEYPENHPLFFGNPSNAICDDNFSQNYLLEKSSFCVCYNNDFLSPVWCAWHLSTKDFGEVKRSTKFTSDFSLPEKWYKVKPTDYQYTIYGFDRGHLCPSADRTKTSELNKETFLMTNMTVQTPNNNRKTWNNLENFCRQLVKKNNELYIFSGIAGIGGTSEKGYFEQIIIDEQNELFIIVPKFTWKIILCLTQGENDFSRVNENSMIFSVCVPNQKDCSSDWKEYICSVDYIEELTNFNFFSKLDEKLQTILESKISLPLPDLLD